jgi:glycosyltransferase involved in cell wall biosynthesis
MVDRTGKLSVIMPAYNEETSIYNNAIETSKTISGIVSKYEIIVVNDGSSDKTLEEARRASFDDLHIQVINSQPNFGKGHALKTGAREATGDYIAFCDADLDLHPRQLESFFDIMLETDCDAVIGSKLHKDSKVDYPWHRKIISWGYYIFLLILFRLNVKDTQTGLKLFRADAIKPVMQKILVKRFAYDIEMLAILHRRGKKIKSAPIEVIFQRGDLGSRIKSKDIFNVTKDTLAIFYRMFILKYYDK